MTFRTEADPDAGCQAVLDWNRDIARSTGVPVGWLLAEEFGHAGGRFHCHQCLVGTAQLYRRFWWQEAFRRFGRSEIRPFNAAKGAAFYAAKYAAKQLGNLHFGGVINGVKLDDISVTARQVAKLGLFPGDPKDAAADPGPGSAGPLAEFLSAPRGRGDYHAGLGRLRRHHCRWPITKADDDEEREQTSCGLIPYRSV